MLRESEYARAYKSPEHLSSQQAAGLRSVDVAPTEEPSFPHKKKTQDHAKRVSFGSGVVEECTPFEQDAALRFRAGVKRPPIPRMTTEYQAHFTWKQPTPPPTPPSPSHRTEQEHSTDRKMEVGGGGGGRGGKHTTEAAPIDHELIQSSTRHDRSEEDRGKVGGRHWQDPRETEGVAASGRPVPRPTLSAKEKCSSKKGCHGKRKRVVRSSPLTTEYRSQFKAPSQVSKEHPETSTDSHVPQGRPDPKASVEQLEREREEEREEEREARERDERDEEREKTSPQRDSLWSPQRGSLWSPQRGTVWSSEYDANFVVPSTLTYRKGAWIGAPHPDLYAPSPPRASSDARHTGSWFDQVVELRQEAEAYKTRQLSDHMHQSVEECGSQGDAASDSTCSSCSSASGGDSDVRPSKTSNRIAAHGQEEVCVEDIEEGGEEEVRGRSGEEEREDGTIHGSHPKRRGQKKTFLSGETAQKSHAYDLRVPRPPRRNLNAQLGCDGRDGWTPTPEVQANRRMNRHGDAIVTSDGPSHPLLSPPPSPPPSPFHPPHSPPTSPPPLSPPPSPSQPTSVTRDEGSNSIPNRTTLTEPRSQATQPPPVPGTSPPRPPHLRSETRHQLPEPSSMAFSVPLSPERSQTDGAQWRAFVRKRNKEQLESHAPSSGKPRRVAPPSGKAAPPSGKVAPPSGKVAPPSGRVAPPSGKVAPPSGKVAPPASEMVPPTRKVSTFPPASHKNTEGTTGHSRRLVSTDVRDTRSTIGKENPHHKGASGGLGTCSTCGAYLFPSRLGRDEEAPPPGKHHSAGSSCRLCSKVQSQVTGHLGSIPSHTDKPLTIHGLHQTEARRYSVPVPESGAHEASPAKHTRGLERHSSELSLSSLSSCSVASDVLARARERKDFWSSAAPPATE